jgi:hypothetical protein
MQSVEIDIKPLLPESESEPDSKPTSCWDVAGDYLGNPKMILGISSVFFTGYITFIWIAGGFNQQFLHFGPGTNNQNTTQFLGIILDTSGRPSA